MAGGSYKQVYVQCPFYCSDDGKQKIICAGIVEDSRLSWSFRNKTAFEMQIDTFCCEHYKKCEIYRVLMDIYDYE